MKKQAPKRRFAWQAEAVYVAECYDCNWSPGLTSTHAAARAIDHARRNSHQVVLHRSIIYDFRGPISRPSTDKET